MDTTKILVIGVAVVVVAAAAGVVIYNTNKDKKSSDLVDLEGWDDIVKDAYGQSVNLGFYVSQDPAINGSFYPYMVQEMKNKYNITVTNVGGYGPGAATAAATEIANGQTTDGSFDLIWGNTSAYNAMIVNGEHYDYVYQKTNAEGKQWGQIIPNAYYLKENSERVISGQFDKYVSGTAVEFSNGQTMFIYNQDFNRKTVTFGNDTVAVPYNCVLVFGDNGSIKALVKVAPAGEGAAFTAGSETALSAQSKSAFEDAWGDCSTAYSIDTVRSILASGGVAKGKIAYGIPSNYTELFFWLNIYKHQFTYPDFNAAWADFHTDLIVQAIIYELTWDGDHGWKAADNKANNIKEVNKLLETTKTAEDFKKNFGYAYNYLNDLEPNINAAGYVGPAVGAVNGLIVGNNAEDKDYGDGTVMLAMTTCTSIDSRVTPGSGHSVVTQYSYNAAVFTMDTGCYSDYYVFIPANSSHVSAAMVVANWLLDPETQFRWYTQTGNGLSIDLDKEVYGDTGKGVGYTVKEKLDNWYPKLSDLTLTLTPDRLAEVTVDSDFTPFLSVSKAAWTAYVQNSSDPIIKG